MKETKTEAYKAEKRYLGISLADIKTSLILSLSLDLYFGKSLHFLTDTYINMKTIRSSGILFKSLWAQCAVEHAEYECGSDIHTAKT